MSLAMSLRMSLGKSPEASIPVLLAVGHGGPDAFGYGNFFYYKKVLPWCASTEVKRRGRIGYFYYDIRLPNVNLGSNSGQHKCFNNLKGKFRVRTYQPDCRQRK